jgi:hypothetical protein
MDTLKELYYDPKQGFVSENKLYEKAKVYGITRKQVHDFLKKQEVSQLFYQRRIKQNFPLTAYGPFQRLQIDLLDVSNEAPRLNGGTKFLFCGIDVYSRYGFCLAQKDKTEGECLKNFKVVNNRIQASGFQVKQVDSDNESAFTGRIFSKYCQDHKIRQHLNIPSDYKSKGVIERWNRTLRGYIARYQHAYGTQKYIQVLPDIIDNYNNTLHRTLGQTPLEAVYFGGISGYIEKQSEKAEKGQRKISTIKVGDRVRLMMKKGIFDKGDQRFTKTIHVIERVENHMYYVADRVNGYRLNELLKVEDVESVPAEQENVQEKKQEERKERRVVRRVHKEGLEIVEPEVGSRSRAPRGFQVEAQNPFVITAILERKIVNEVSPLGKKEPWLKVKYAHYRNPEWVKEGAAKRSVGYQKALKDFKG